MFTDRFRPFLVTPTVIACLLATFAHAENATGAENTTGVDPLAAVTVTEWKPVFARVQTRDQVPARARIGGTLTVLDVTEGDLVEAGQRVGLIEDTKLLFQIESFDAQLSAAQSQLEKAQEDLVRGLSLAERGVISTARLEALETNVSVVEGQISSLEANRQSVSRQIEEGAILAPETGVVLDVPVSAGGVIFAGESVAVIGSGGAFLRLSVSERFAGDLKQGDPIEISENGVMRTGTLAKLYPLIESGRLEADVEVAGLAADFVGQRVPVRLPVGTREAILVPESALFSSGGLDFVTVEKTNETHSEETALTQRVVVPGKTILYNDAPHVEILSGLSVGDRVVLSHE